MRKGTDMLLSKAPGHHSQEHGHGHGLPCRDEESNKSWMLNEREYSCCCPCRAVLLWPKSQGIQWRRGKKKKRKPLLDTQMQKLADLSN